jgi:hypothetical protein
MASFPWMDADLLAAPRGGASAASRDGALGMPEPMVWRGVKKGTACGMDRRLARLARGYCAPK